MEPWGTVEAAAVAAVPEVALLQLLVLVLVLLSRSIESFVQPFVGDTGSYAVPGTLAVNPNLQCSFGMSVRF